MVDCAFRWIEIRSCGRFIPRSHCSSCASCEIPLSAPLPPIRSRARPAISTVPSARRKVSADRPATPLPIAPPDDNLTPPPLQASLLTAAALKALRSKHTGHAWTLRIAFFCPQRGAPSSPRILHGPTPARPHPAYASAFDRCPDRCPHLNQVSAAMLLAMSARSPR